MTINANADSIQSSAEKSLIRRDSDDSIASKTSASAVSAAQVSQTPTPVSAVASVTPTNVRPMAQKIQSQFHFVDGVWLSDRGLNQIKALQLEQPKRTRVKRGPKQALNAVKTEEMDEASKEDDGSIEEKQAEDNIIPKGDDNGEKKKRQRRLHKLGIGGFSVKQRGRMSATKDEDTNLEVEVNATELTGNQESVASDKPKRRRRISKKKNQLQDSFPQYMQEAFFGKSLLDSSQTEAYRTTIGAALSEEDDTLTKSITKDKLIVLTPNEIAAVKSQKPKAEATSLGLDDKSESPLDDDEDFQDLLPPLPPDDELMDMLDHINDEGLDRNDESLSNLSVDGKESETTAKDDAIDLLSPHFNLDGIVGGSSLPQMDSKDVEDLFKGVLSPHNTEDGDDFNAILGPSTSGLTNKTLLPIQIPPPPLTSPLAPPPTHNLMPASSVPLPQLMHSKQSNVETSVNVPMIDSPYNMPPPSPFPVPISDPPSQFSPQIAEPQSPWPSESEEQITSQGQKNMIKWEADEALGSMATISPVLYANLNHPNLKSEFPNWNDRIKQISKLWRQLATDQRQPFLQKARENRAANRIQKAQSESQRRTEPAKEVRVTSALPPVTTRDGENERQWKHLQAARQQQQVQHQQVIHEQRQSLLKTQTMAPGPISPGADSIRPQFLQNIPSSPSPMTREFGPNESGPPMTPVAQSPMQSPVQVSFGSSMTRPQVQSPSAASPMSPVIQVSRVRPPIDPNKLPVASAGCKPMQYDPYSQQPNTPRPQVSLQPVLKPNTPQQRSPFSPSSPGASHMSSAFAQSSGETFQTPPSTPRPQSNDNHNQTSLPSSPYGQPRTPQSSPFSPNHILSQNQQQCVDSYSVSNQVQRQQSFGEYHNNGNENSPNTECLFQNIGQRMARRTPDPFNQNQASPNTDIYSRPVATPQPPQSPQTDAIPKMAIQNDPYARSPMTPRPQPQPAPSQRQSVDEIYSQQPPTPQMAQQSSPYVQPMTPRPNFQQQMQSPPMPSPQPMPQHDPYAYQPSTPRPLSSRPALQSIRQPNLMRPPPTSPVDPYARQPGTPMPPLHQDLYAKPPGTPMPMPVNDRQQEATDSQLSRQHLRDLLQRQQVRRQQVSDAPPRLWPGLSIVLSSII